MMLEFIQKWLLMNEKKAKIPERHNYIITEVFIR